MSVEYFWFEFTVTFIGTLSMYMKRFIASWKMCNSVFTVISDDEDRSVRALDILIYSYILPRVIDRQP